MKSAFIMPLGDEQMRLRLLAGETICFWGGCVVWQEIERQVERLGFGELYIVSATRGRHSGQARVRLKPVALAVAAEAA